MIKLKQITRTFGDETAGYSVTLDKEYTVSELFNEILSKKSDWGYFTVKGSISSEYRWGNIISNIKQEDSEKKVLSVSASGGWSRMDYVIDAI